MKKLTPFLLISVFILFIVALFLSLGKVQKMVVIKEGNIQKVPLEIVLNKYQDSDCGMVIKDRTYLSEVIAPDGKTWFFHDHGDFVHWLEDKPFKDEAVIWVRTKDTKRWLHAQDAYYSLNDITPMGYGFGAYEKNQKNFVSYDTFRLKMLRGETMKDPKIRKKLLGLK